MKLKTSKSAKKRFKITKSGKVLRRKAAQNHFNAKSPGKLKRKRHKESPIPETYPKKQLMRLLPYIN